MGKPGPKPTLDTVAVAADIASLNGNFAAVAKKHGVTRQAVQNLVRKHKSLQAVAADAREGMLDNAESSLYRAVLAGEAWAVCFFLKTQAKDRGYLEKSPPEPKGDGAEKGFTVEQVTQLLAVFGARRPQPDGTGGAAADPLAPHPVVPEPRPAEPGVLE